MNNIKVKQVEETTLEGYIKLSIYRYSLEKHFFNPTEYILRVQYIEGELVNLSLNGGRPARVLSHKPIVDNNT